MYAGAKRNAIDCAHLSIYDICKSQNFILIGTFTRNVIKVSFQKGFNLFILRPERPSFLNSTTDLVHNSN
jgi:hypothetical protein